MVMSLAEILQLNNEEQKFKEFKSLCQKIDFRTSQTMAALIDAQKQTLVDFLCASTANYSTFFKYSIDFQIALANLNESQQVQIVDFLFSNTYVFQKIFVKLIDVTGFMNFCPTHKKRLYDFLLQHDDILQKFTQENLFHLPAMPAVNDLRCLVAHQASRNFLLAYHGANNRGKLNIIGENMWLKILDYTMPPSSFNSQTQQIIQKTWHHFAQQCPKCYSALLPRKKKPKLV